MTIRALTQITYGGNIIPAGAVVNVIDAGTEAGLIGAGVAELSTAPATWTPGVSKVESNLSAGQQARVQSILSATFLASVGLQNARGLRRWRAAWASAHAEYGVARVHCLGDSVTLGTYSDDANIPTDDIADAQGFVGRLRTMLARRCNATPAGYIAANDKRNTVTGAGAATGTVGPCINTVRSTGSATLGGALPLPAGATISIPVPACVNLEIWYFDSNSTGAAGGTGSSTGTFSYSVDGGGTTTTVADNTAPVNYKKITITGLSNATHTLLLTGVSATCYIVGIWYYGASGAIVSRLGLGSATALDLSGEGWVTHLATAGTQRILGSFGPSAAPTVITGSIKAGSRVVTGISSTAGLAAGMPVGAAAQLTLPCLITSVDSPTQITLSAPATADNASRGMYVGSGVTLTGDLWIIALGHNDWQRQNDSTYPTPVPVFKAALQRIIDLMTGNGASVLLVGEPKSNNSSPTPETYVDADYWRALDELALANDHVASLRISSAWGTFAQGKALGLQSDAGGVHPLKRGSADMAQLLSHVLTASVGTEAVF